MDQTMVTTLVEKTYPSSRLGVFCPTRCALALVLLLGLLSLPGQVSAAGPESPQAQPVRQWPLGKSVTVRHWTKDNGFIREWRSAQGTSRLERTTWIANGVRFRHTKTVKADGSTRFQREVLQQRFGRRPIWVPVRSRSELVRPRLYLHYLGLLTDVAKKQITSAELARGLYLFGCTKEHLFERGEARPGSGPEPIESGRVQAREHLRQFGLSQAQADQAFEAVKSIMTQAQAEGRADFRPPGGRSTVEQLNGLLKGNGQRQLSPATIDRFHLTINYNDDNIMRALKHSRVGVAPLIHQALDLPVRRSWSGARNIRHRP